MLRSRKALLLSVVAALALTACDGAAADPVAKTGTIRGTCRLSEAVTPWVVPVKNACAKGQAWGVDHKTQRLVLGEGLALANCLVGLKEAPAGKEWPEAMRSEERTATIAVRDGDFQPHVTWARSRTQMIFQNASTCGGSVHGFFQSLAETKFNFALPPKSVKSDIENAFLDKPGVYILRDDCFPWLNGYVHVVEHPYFDLTSAAARPEAGAKAGEFVLADVPPGQYEVVCWHEGMDETQRIQDGMLTEYTYSSDIRLTASVKVEAGKTTTVDFTVPAPKPPAK